MSEEVKTIATNIAQTIGNLSEDGAKKAMAILSGAAAAIKHEEAKHEESE